MCCLKVGSVSELLQSNSQIANLEESRVINRLYNSLDRLILTNHFCSLKLSQILFLFLIEIL